MSARHDDGTPLSPEEEAFVGMLSDVYVAPPMTAPQRTRFDARLEARVLERFPRRRAWLVAFASAAAALSLLVWRAQIDAPGGATAQVEASQTAAGEVAASDDAWILAMATESAADADDALPTEYLAISDLLLGD